MEISATQNVSHPAQQVFEAVRDKQSALVRFMPNIESCEVLERNEEPPEVRLLNRWQATMDDIPKLLRSVVSPNLVAWRDHATWNSETLSCLWTLERLAPLQNLGT